MLLDPKEYRKEFENESLKKILNERDRIIQFMHDFEDDKIPQKYYERDPSPDMIYYKYVSYLKEICDLIKIKIYKKDHKTVRLSPFLAIEEVISKFDDEKREHFFEDLKTKDAELYYRYLEWKKNRQKTDLI